MSDIQRIDFHNHNLQSWQDDTTGTIYVAMRALCIQIGLAWGSQQQKLTQGHLYQHNVRRIDIDTPGGQQEVVGLDLDLLPAWLFSISPEKVAPDIQETLILFQKECVKALRDYWITGTALNPRASSPQPLALPSAHERLDVLKACANALEALGVFDDRDKIEFGAYIRQVARAEMQPLLGPGTTDTPPTPVLWTLSMRLHALKYPPLHGPESTSMQIKLGSAAKKAYAQMYNEPPKKMWDYVKGQMREVNAYPAERIGVLDETIATYLGVNHA